MKPIVPKKHEPVRIGFYICHCGTNIAGMVDVEAVAKYAAKLPNVAVSRNYKYMCSDPGQELIQQDIREHQLNRIVVAACSPLLHEHTFRKATEAGGLNPFFFQMVNIREHDSWVHTDRAEATRKAMALARAAVQRVPHHKPLEIKKVADQPERAGGGRRHRRHPRGADPGQRRQDGLSGRARGHHRRAHGEVRQDLPDAGLRRVHPHAQDVGGGLASRTSHLWTYSEVAKVDGYVGNFKVTVQRKPRYIIEDLCTGCQECVDACVYKEPKFADEFNLGLGKRKPVYMPFPQATPPVVDDRPGDLPELQARQESGRLHRVRQVQEDLRRGLRRPQGHRLQADRRRSRRSRSAPSSWPPGSRSSTPSACPYYGYGIYPNVYNALEIERLVNASGPTGGEVVLRNGQKPKTVGIIHCVGSRDENTNRWCSRVCCLYSLKLAHLHQGAHGRRDLQLLHRHADARQEHGGVLQPHRRGRRAPHPRQGGRRLSRPERRRRPAGW